MSGTKTTVRCGECRTLLHEDPGLTEKPPCPECGSTRRDVAVEMTATANVYGSISMVRVREYVTHDVLWLSLSVVLTIVGAVVSTWLLSGWASFVISLALAVVGFFVGLRAAVRVIDREHFGRLR
jgi:hypothetical protein